VAKKAQRAAAVLCRFTYDQAGESAMRRLVIWSAALAGFAGPVLAADLPRHAPPTAVPIAPVFTWAGFYFGTNTAVINVHGTIRTYGNAPNTLSEIASGQRPSSVSSDNTNFASGAQIGFNTQFGSTVIGVEADLTYGGVSRREISFGALNEPNIFRQDLDWLGTARARAGVAFDQVLVYATGGLAFADVTNRVSFHRATDSAFQYLGRSSDWAVGYTVGGGVEFMLPAALERFSFIGRLIGASSVTVRAEYLYFDLGEKSVIVNALPCVALNSFTSHFETRGHIGRVGFNYRFGT
jgi:outer membrane immunogenic protein